MKIMSSLQQGKENSVQGLREKSVCGRTHLSSSKEWTQAKKTLYDY